MRYLNIRKYLSSVLILLVAVGCSVACLLPVDSLNKENYQVLTEAIPIKQRIPQNYSGGPAIIFRLDDVSKVWYEDTVEEIIKLFKKTVSLCTSVSWPMLTEPTLSLFPGLKNMLTREMLESASTAGTGLFTSLTQSSCI